MLYITDEPGEPGDPAGELLAEEQLERGVNKQVLQ